MNALFAFAKVSEDGSAKFLKSLAAKSKRYVAFGESKFDTWKSMDIAQKHFDRNRSALEDDVVIVSFKYVENGVELLSSDADLNESASPAEEEVIKEEPKKAPTKEVDPDYDPMEDEFWKDLNPTCIGCNRGCKQSSKVTLIQCPQYSPR